MDTYKKLFNSLKTHDLNEFNQILNDNLELDLNVRDNSYNYLIHYVIMYNYIDELDILLNRNIRIDIQDIDGRTLLYNPIKYGYNEIVKKILDVDNKTVGISIFNIKDRDGMIPLHYVILFNNIDIFNYMIKFSFDKNEIDNDGNTSLILSIKNKKQDITNLLINNNVDINIINKEGETAVHYTVLNDQNNTLKQLIIRNANINKFDYKYKLTPLIYSIILDNSESFNLLLKSEKLNINHQDNWGNTALHYTIKEKSTLKTTQILKIQSINYNLTNINGETPLHIFLKNNNNNVEILNNLMINTNLNIQDTDGNTVLYYLLTSIDISDYSEILINKKMNIFISNIDGNTVYNYDKSNKLLDIVIKSYYNKLLTNKMWKHKWENKCRKKEISTDDCMLYIKKHITKNKVSYPIIKKKKTIFIDTGIYTDNCSYTGVTIDIISGMIFLSQEFNNIGTTLTNNFIDNINVLEYYKSLGIFSSYRSDFLNFEIMWIYQKLYVPTIFHSKIEELLKVGTEYIIIPIGIDIENGSHANILIWYVNDNIIERFEPSGTLYPNSFYYNPSLLDKLLTTLFTNFNKDIKYIKPSEYSPFNGFQYYEMNETKCQKIGDPNGFCAVWCIWWVYHRLRNTDIPSKKLVSKLIKKIKIENLSFKHIIRNFTKKIVNIRDSLLQDEQININNWINDNYTDDQFQQVIKNILNYI
jgi:ankyrin repeat protein